MTGKNERIGLTITTAVYKAARDTYSWGPGVREEYILHYVKKGKGFFEHEGKTYALKEGQCFLIRPGTLIHYYPDAEDPWEYAWIDFIGLEAKRLLKQCALSIQTPIADSIDPEIVGLFRRIAENFKQPTAANICRNIGYLHLILAYFIEQYPLKEDKNSIGNIIDAATEYIENNCRRQDLSIDSLARALNINRASLYRYFMREFGVTPKEYITDVRIEKASALLKNSDFSIKSIAYSTGYSDQLYFSKVFKKKTGLSPREYRNSQEI